MQRRPQRGRQRSRQQALGHLGRNQDEYTITAILVTAAVPRDSRPAERLLHRAIQASTNSHLMRIGAAQIPEPLDVNYDDGPVNCQLLILHLSPPRTRQKQSSP